MYIYLTYCSALAVNEEREPVTVPRKTDPFTHSLLLLLTHSFTAAWPSLVLAGAS